MLRRLLKPFVLLATTAALAAAVATPAQAWTAGNVWVNFGSWNCPSGGSVYSIHWAVDGFSSGGDAGDNVIYPRVRVGAGAYNTLSYSIQCKRGWYLYPIGGMAGQRYLTPYRSGLSYTF
jgi:hypothetical protein